MRKVIVICPTGRNNDSEPTAKELAYEAAAMHHSLSLGEAPLLARTLYSAVGIVRPYDRAEEVAAIAAKDAYLGSADRVVLYVDIILGHEGQDFDRAVHLGVPVEIRGFNETMVRHANEKKVARINGVDVIYAPSTYPPALFPATEFAPTDSSTKE